MKRKVIESFHFAADGVRADLMKAGRWYVFPAEHAARFEAEGKLERAVRPGDRVQWIARGATVFDRPARVACVDEDFVFVEDSDIGIPVEEVARLS